MPRLQAYTVEQVREMVIAEAKLAGNGSALARKWRMSREFVLSVMKGQEGPGPKMLSRLGLKRVVFYVKM